MFVGLMLLVRRAMRLTLFLFVAQMVGTFLTFFVLPEVTFRDGNPLLLTVEGEFVVKNLVLISAAMVVGTTIRRGSAWVAFAGSDGARGVGPRGLES